jgi:very-short-patch-repair endonuclease
MRDKSTSSPRVSTKQRIAQIEQESGQPFREWLYQTYVVGRVSAIEITRRHGIMFRALRTLCREYGFEMRSISEGVQDSWVGCDDRREQSRERLARFMATIDITGDNNPAKRPEVRAKISAAKNLDNAIKRPEVRAKMSASKRAFYLANPDKHINYLMGKRHLRSGLEQKMQHALRKAGILTQHSQRIGTRWPDLVIRRARLVIEVDGSRWHNAEADAIRDAELMAVGWTVLHITDLQMNSDISTCVNVVRQWLIDHGFRNHIESEVDQLPRQCSLQLP